MDTGAYEDADAFLDAYFAALDTYAELAADKSSGLAVSLAILDADLCAVRDTLANAVLRAYTEADAECESLIHSSRDAFGVPVSCPYCDAIGDTDAADVLVPDDDAPPYRHGHD